MAVDRARFPNYSAGDYISDLQVMKSAAGWYIGRSYWDEEYEFEGPYSRESGYFKSESAAFEALTSGEYQIRDCVENNWAYDTGVLPDIRKD